MEKNKRNKIIGLTIGILIVLIIVASSTYAYWQITRTQETPNDIVAACLNLDLADASAAIDLDSAWPISDEEGKNLTGYTFTVTNNCDEEINYIIGLNRVEESNYLLDSSIKLQLDDNSTHVYGELSDVEYSDADNTEYTARSSKQVSVETIGANGTNTHTIRIWVSDEAPVSEQSKIFKGQIFITGGQGIEVPECFTIADNGTILGYDESCGLEVKVPAEINGIQVKEINAASFRPGDVTSITTYIDEDTPQYIIYWRNDTYREEIIEKMKDMVCEDSTTCDLEETGYIMINSLEEYNNFDWSKYISVGYEGNISYDETNDELLMDMGDYSQPHNIESIDLSQAIYLEKIGYRTLYGDYESNTQTDDTCQYNASLNKYYCKGVLKKLTLPQYGMLTTIDGLAFSDNQLSEVTIPSSVTTILDSAFSDNKLTSLSFIDLVENPSKLTTIEYSAFRNNQLVKVVLPGTITFVGHQAFEGNDTLTEVIIKKESADGITFDGYGWFNDVTPTYNPNYTE